MAFDGDISLEDFARAIVRFRGIVDALQAEISPNARIDWLIEDLQHGSAIATVRGMSPTVEAIEPIGAAFLVVGRALAEGRPVPYSPRVAKEALGLTKLLGGTITSIRFETAEADATVVDGLSHEQLLPFSTAYGAVEGRVQTLTSRDSLRFTLYDSVHDRAVACYLDEGHQNIMRNAWDRRAIIEGRVTRERQTGRPLVVRNIRRISLLDDVVPGMAIRAARGLAPTAPGQRTATEVVRWLRDA